MAFLFSPPTNYPQKPPLAVSGKLSATLNPGKVAQMLRFFGKPLCHTRNLTQCVTYYKSKRVYYNIPSSFSQAAIHTSRDSNCGLKNYPIFRIHVLFTYTLQLYDIVLCDCHYAYRDIAGEYKKIHNESFFDLFDLFVYLDTDIHNMIFLLFYRTYGNHFYFRACPDVSS